MEILRTIERVEKLDLYTCSHKSINEACKTLEHQLLSMINRGKAKTELYLRGHKIHKLASRARLGMDAKGYMLTSRINRS
jgi:S-adenosylmethionine/arginine decarboxylase-like enzyme